MIPPIFRGQSVVIVGGGPSLTGFDFERLRGRNVVAVNKALFDCPFAQVLWFSDVECGFWRDHEKDVLASPIPYKATAQRTERKKIQLPPEIIQYRFTGMKGFDPAPGCLRSGNNSGYAAIHLAAKSDPRLIILLGLDMRHSGGRTHYHGGYGRLHLERTLRDEMLPYFPSLAEPLFRRGISVINGSPDSLLDIWPRMGIDEALEH